MMTWNSFFFHSPSSYLLEAVCSMHDYVMMFMISVMFLVLFLISGALLSGFFSLNFFESHELEFIWTMLPFILLMFILIPSLNSLYMLDSCSFCGLTIFVTGHQWYWSYFIKDLSNILFDSYMVSDSFVRLIEVDNRLVIPCSLPVRFLVSSADVIHSWTIPSFGVKMDAVPGRVNQFCFSIKRSGVFFGQCSEICGANHSFMPIVLESVPFKNFISMI